MDRINYGTAKIVDDNKNIHSGVSSITSTIKVEVIDEINVYQQLVSAVSMEDDLWVTWDKGEIWGELRDESRFTILEDSDEYDWQLDKTNIRFKKIN